MRVHHSDTILKMCIVRKHDYSHTMSVCFLFFFTLCIFLLVMMQSFLSSEAVSSSNIFSHSEHKFNTDFQITADQAEFFSHNSSQQLFKNVHLELTNNIHDNKSFLIKFIIVVNMCNQEFIFESIESF